ncbi:MAG TPA: hypothetical protein VGI16_07745 [Candidatus Acidoferrum sp.]|jgi:hypothetical protein
MKQTKVFSALTALAVLLMVLPVVSFVNITASKHLTAVAVLVTDGSPPPPPTPLPVPPGGMRNDAIANLSVNT